MGLKCGMGLLGYLSMAFNYIYTYGKSPEEKYPWDEFPKENFMEQDEEIFLEVDENLMEEEEHDRDKEFGHNSFKDNVIVKSMFKDFLCWPY